jgi:hypothetical protein
MELAGFPRSLGKTTPTIHVTEGRSFAEIVLWQMEGDKPSAFLEALLNLLEELHYLSLEILSRKSFSK